MGDQPQGADASPAFLSGGGEVGALMRAKDWSATSLGPPSRWPRSLQTCIRIVLTSRQPMFVWWGEELINLYNDAYKAIVGGKHPEALGQPAAVVWREIWDQVGPRADYAMQRNEGTYDEALLLLMERYGYREETYYTFSYSPVPNDDGGIGGILCANTDDTQRIISERRLDLLRELAAGATQARSVEDACRLLAQALETNPWDLPFALVYLLEPERRRATLACAAGMAPGPANPQEIALDGETIWPIEAALNDGNVTHVVDLSGFSSSLPTGAWDRHPSHAAVVAIAPQGYTGQRGVLIAGLNPYRVFDVAYERLLGLVAGQVAAAIASADAHEQERRRAEALADLDRAKTTFFSNASHEFRTPLTLMLSPLEDLLIRHPTAQTVVAARRDIELIHRNGMRLLKLVNTLLDFSRIEAGRVQAVYEPVDLATRTGELASAFRSAMERAGLRYIVDCPPLAQPIYVDIDMWEKIVLNLLSDAFKYTLEGEVEITLHLSTDERHVLLTVRDTGVGIPEHELPHLFERFHRIEGQRGRTQEGTGIGLALVQELVRLHGGLVAVESRVGHGTRFTVSIPTGSAHLPADRIQVPRSLSSTGVQAGAFVEEALRWLPDGDSSDAALERDLIGGVPAPPMTADPALVLLADDNADMRDYVRRLLAERYQVEAVADGQAALEAARRRRPDLVLSDVMMPRLDGFGLLRALKADDDLRGVPVMLLSARAGEEASIEGLEAGADDYLVKPFSARELLARVTANVELARERRRTQETLQDLNEVLAQQVAERTADRNRLWQLSADIMLVARNDGVITAVNPAWAVVLGWTEPELLGRGITDLVHPDDFEVTQDRFRRIGGGASLSRFDSRYRHKDGSYRFISWSTAPGEGLIIAVGRDVTVARQQAEALRQSEEKLRQSQKMEAIGQLTGGVAHDFNNMMQVVLGNLDAVRRRLSHGGTDRSTGGDLVRFIDSALRGVERASALTRQLLAFSRRQPLDPRPTNISKLMVGMSDLLRRTLGETIAIETVSAGGLWQALVDANQLENAILNLAVNARDAMPDGGKLTIETANAWLDEAYATAHDELLPGQYVLISVSDNGVGMSREVVGKAFDPFFTTKDVGHGTGLGLSQVYGFVKQSGGHVSIYSEPGEGTTVKLYLPRLHGQDGDSDIMTAAPQVPLSEAAELVLLVEDEPDVRGATSSMLVELGYRVIAVPDGPAALRVLQERRDIRLLFTDVGLPGGMNGRQLTDAARALFPELPVLFTTGYAGNAIVHHGRLDPGIDLLVKPFTYTELAKKLRRVLEA